MFDIYTDAYFLSQFIIFNFLHMFVLPGVTSSGIAVVGLLVIIFFIQMFLVDSLQHCISYCLTNSTLHFLMT